MDLMILGCNGPYPAACGATAGYLVNTNKGIIALDMGSGVFERLSRLCKPEEVKAVVLSHLHYDHISDMGVYNYYLEVLFKQGKLKNKVLCYAPVDGMAFGQLKEKYPYFEFIPVREGKVTFIGDTKAQFLKLRHGAANYGVRLTDDETGRKLVYSGDTNVCENLEKLLSSCDLWLGGAPFIGEEYQAEGGHLSVEVMQSLAEKYSVHAVVTHLCPQHDAKDYEKACTSELLSVAKTFRSYHV